MGELIKDESNYNPPAVDSAWLKFKEGITTIRLLSHSYHFRNHYVKSENKTYDCTGMIETCELCQKGNPSRQRWAYLVLVRDKENPAVKVMEVGWSVFETILNLSKDEDYGDPRGYDLKITRTGKGAETSYTVIPGKDTPLNDKEEKLVNLQGLDNIEKASEKLMSYYKKGSSE
jgi:hypothetical protein